jgi:hypothetical protein
MVAKELGVRAANDAFRDSPGGTNLDCAVNRAFRLGLDADEKRPRKGRENDCRARKVLVDVVVVVVEAIAKAGDQIGRRLLAPQ